MRVHCSDREVEACAHEELAGSVLSEGVSGCALVLVRLWLGRGWGWAAKSHVALGLPAVSLQWPLGVWPRQEGVTTKKWGSGAGLLVGSDVSTAGCTWGGPFLPSLCHPLSSESSAIPQLADWACGPALPSLNPGGREQAIRRVGTQ